MDYKRAIIEMLDTVENSGALEYLYTFIQLFLEKWG